MRESYTFHYVNTNNTLQQGLELVETLHRKLHKMATNFTISSIKVEVEQKEIEDPEIIKLLETFPKLPETLDLSDTDYHWWVKKSCEFLMAKNYDIIPNDLWRIFQDRFTIAHMMNQMAHGVYEAPPSPDDVIPFQFTKMNLVINRCRLPYEIIDRYQHDGSHNFLGYQIIQVDPNQKQFIDLPLHLLARPKYRFPRRYS